MPWCDDCSRYSPLKDLTDGGGCPGCGRVLGPPPKAPWHFKLLVLAVVLYIGYRAWQGIEWVLGKL